MNHYFAVLDDQHDVDDPVTVVRVAEGAGPHGVMRLNEDAAWSQTGLLDRIRSGELPYRLQPITAEAAARIREQREKTIDFRYSILVADDDPTNKPSGVLREWDASDGRGSYAETFTRAGEWEHSTVRMDIERGSNIANRIVPADEATVRRFTRSRRPAFRQGQAHLPG
ncbi:hypothetical protein Ade02nite_96600 [Paractinoplanes deccanensis]|uniref:Uncharacterized protein n=1 Tax=Paractinoplanes deccanensis TaxID=113561 RepID=A0ABQ3YLZ4_9ACTN|nr:hypothetical protein [Actinoplanes deccanensis]GID81019.1 hypothetical protein Ade02nite_96600 [Actinoplanes deccanensis]